MTDKTAEQTAIRRKLLANGYTPLANVSKKCMLKNWPRLVVTDEMIEDWADAKAYRATGVRIEGDLVALDFDIDDAAALDAIWDALPDALFSVVDRMPVRRGSGEKVCLFCRVPGGVEHIWSKAYYKPGEEDLDGAATHRLEIFGSHSAGRQVGVYGAHTVEAGEVLVSYAWADGRGLCEVPFDQLPEATIAQLEALADVVSSVLLDLGWVYEVKSLDGRVSGGREYVLEESDVFDVHGGQGGEIVGLLELEDMARRWDGVRVSMSWREGASARNTTRGIVGINPMDDRVQIWDSMTGILYRPVSVGVQDKVGRLGERLNRVGVSGGSAGTDGEPGSGGRGQSNLERMIATVPVENRLFRESPEENGGAGEGGVPFEALGKPVLDISSGRLAVATVEAAAALCASETVFDMGGRLVTLGDEGVIVEMTEARTALELGAMFRCIRIEKRGEKERVVDVDPPQGLVRQVLSCVKETGYRALRGVVDVPVLCGDGSLVGDGYDAGSRLVVSDDMDVAGLLAGSDERDVRDALDVLWRPFAEFPFAGAGDRGGALACALTAVCRAWLPTAPAFAFDAPVQGSGKSLLCRALGALSGNCLLHAPLPLRDEDEVRKTLLSILLDAPRSVIFDNQLGLVDSASLGGMLTAEVFSGRMLGSNTTIKAPTGVLVMLNGNNLSIGGDMPRRTVRVRIDPQMETPFERQFDFDPETWVRENRRELVAAALVLLRWGMSAAGKGRVGSFERWDQVVGQTVARIGAELDDQFGDPADVIRAAHADDPRRDELGDLLTALRDEFGNKWFTGAEVAARMAGAGATNPLVEAFGYDKAPNSKAVGRHLSFRRDAKVDGLCIQASKDPHKKVNRFRVWSDDDEADVVVDGALEQRRTAQKDKMGAIVRNG